MNGLGLINRRYGVLFLGLLMVLVACGGDT